MLPKSERLKKRYLFNIVFKKGRKLSSEFLSFFYLFKKRENNDIPKAAFVAGLKIDKRSTKRNLIKRRIKAAYMLLKKKLINTNKNLFNPYLAFIFIAKPNAKNATFEQIKESMDVLLRKLQNG